MKLDLKIGDYVRYVPTLGEYTQKISKITNMKNCLLDMCYTLDNKEEVYTDHFDDIIKASDKLIDLIEDGDYVNGCKVVEILKETIIIENYGEEELFNEKIKSIVTKECFEQMSYKVEEKKNEK